MKTMTCRQLGGACNQEFHAETFEALAELTKQHNTEMLQNNDAAHLQAMASMSTMMRDPQLMVEWVEKKQAEFTALPDDAL